MPRHRILGLFMRGSLLALPAVLLLAYSWGLAEQPEQVKRGLGETPSRFESTNRGNRAGTLKSELQESLALLQDSTSGDDTEAVKTTFKYKGPENCQLCHNSSDPDHSRDFVLLNESKIFIEQDKHRLAYELLEGELGKRIASHLGIEKISEAKECLSCHANWQAEQGYPKPEHFERGVSCESCHGPSSAWFEPHTDKAWRKKSIAEKESLGMVDVRNPARRAEQCLSCHIGNVQQGKVVTHEMYAAGHPPLPSIEIESFAAQMPPHWRYLQEKGDFEFRKEYIAQAEADIMHDPSDDLPRSRGVIIGGVSELQMSVKLFSEQAKQHADVWPELAVFDCAACHHDLKSPSWRQRRGYGKSPPGRPHMTAWPTALVRLGIAHRAGNDAERYKQDVAGLEAKLDSLRAVLDKQPFGHPDNIHAAGTEIVSWLETLNEDLLKMPFRKDAAERALAELGIVPASNDDYFYPDYNSARQISWAIKTISTELGAPYPEFPDKDEFLKWRADVQAAAALEVNQKFDSRMLNDRLFLILPAGQKTTVAEKLHGSLKTMSEYDPNWFLNQLPGLVKELKQVGGE